MKQNQTSFYGIYSNLTSYPFFKKNKLKYFKIEISHFKTKGNPNNGNETKSDIFPWNIFKSDVIYFCVKKYYSISMTFKIRFSQFYN